MHEAHEAWVRHLARQGLALFVALPGGQRDTRENDRTVSDGDNDPIYNAPMPGGPSGLCLRACMCVCSLWFASCPCSFRHASSKFIQLRSAPPPKSSCTAANVRPRHQKNSWSPTRSNLSSLGNGGGKDGGALPTTSSKHIRCRKTLSLSSGCF